MLCGGVFAPVIEYIVNLVYQLMKAVQSVVYAFSGINIFAKATANSMNKTASSAKQVNKSLTGVHNDINNVSDNNNKNNVDSVNNSIGPSFDLSQVDTKITGYAEKLYNFFIPLKQSWDNYGQSLIEQIKSTVSQIVVLIASVWGSFEAIITNGTVYSIFENILEIIGNIAEAFSNAWNYNGNGDAIIQNLANAFDNLLNVINNIVKSDEFQNFLKYCSDKLREISEKIESINWEPLINVLSTIGSAIGTVALNILSGLVDIFKWIAEHPIIAEIIISIAIAIGILSTALSIVSAVITVLTPIVEALNLSFLKMSMIILIIIAVVAAVIFVIMNWGSICEWISGIWEWLKEKAIEIFSQIGEFLSNIWNGICEFFKNIWNTIVNFIVERINKTREEIIMVFSFIANFFSEIWNTIKFTISNVWNAIVVTITNTINNIKNTISNILNSIKAIWENIWNGLKNTVTNIFNNIWNVIKGVINSILGGIEGMANGVIRGVNSVIKVLNNLHFNIPDWVPLLGGKSFGLNLRTLNEISLPRLAKGGIIDSPTIALMGEYAGVKSNPEIVTPENKMYDTMVRAISDVGIYNNEQPMRIQFFLGKDLIVDEIINGINEKTRQTGKAQIKLGYV